MNKVMESELRSLYESGKSMQEIADTLGVAVGTVYNRFKEYGIDSRPAHMGFKGKHHSLESRKTIGESQRGKVISKKTRERMAESKFKGGIGHKKKRSDGYISIYFPDHPMSSKDGYIMEHILVMEAVIGRHLNDDEVVHHINHKRDDNRKSNLKLMTNSEHMSMHMKERYIKKGGMTY